MLIVVRRGLAPLAGAGATQTAPDWKQASAAWIARALERTQRRPAGGWYVIDARRTIGDGPRAYRIAGRELVVWRAGGRLHVAPDACPHMGAPLSGATLRDGSLICPWHGLALAPEGHGNWCSLPSHDDGVLLWVRLPDADQPTEQPVLPVRPTPAVDAVIRTEAKCEPRDVIANRLDPWHGVHLHPYAFARLRVLDRGEDSVSVRVVYRLASAVGVEVDARFSCPDRRSIVMTITAGTGRGSVVETHVTPVAPGRTAIVEASLVAADGSSLIRHLLSGIARPLLRRAARRLWVDDAAYAERRFALRRLDAPASRSDRDEM